MKNPLLLLLLVLPTVSLADEGMWLPNQPPRELLRKNHGFDLSDAFLDRAMKASVRFNNGGSGGFVSPHGLVVTNHHIGADSLQKLRTKETNLSPVLNRAGEFVGINFDRNRHGLVRNFVYTEEQARHISVNCEAVLHSLRTLYGADSLVAELTKRERGTVMAKIHAATLIVLIAVLTSPAAAQDVGGAGLRIAIVVAPDKLGKLVIQHHEHFNVHFTNRSDKPIRIWDEASPPGHDTLNFRIAEKKGAPWTMRRSPDAYYEEQPLKTISIAAGATYVRRVTPLEMRDNTYVWTGILEPNSGEDVTLVPIFEIKADAQTKKLGVWTGRIEGPAVQVRVVHPKLTTPHEYLSRQCPKQAIRVMQADPTWIHKQDLQFMCTPLHHASRCGFVEAVDWLLEQGADVDARAGGDCSPLAFAKTPEVVQAILRHKPKDKERAAEFFRSPLESAAASVAWGGADAKKQLRFVRLMLDAGAPYTLQVAAYLNDVSRVREALKENPSLADVLNGSDRKPLRIAAEQGRAEICKILLEHKADPNDWEHGVGFPILVGAVRHAAVVKILLDAGADVKTRISARRWAGHRSIDDDATLLHFAAEAGALESARLLLDAGVDVNAKDKGGQTALDVAVHCGKGDVAMLLADRMGTAEARDKGMQALLHQLVFSADSDRLTKVLKEKAVADIFARVGPAFMLSAAYEVQVPEQEWQKGDNSRSVATIALLHAHGIPIDLYSAITSDDLARVKSLLKSEPALARSQGPDGRPVLHRAAALDHRAILHMLLVAGADANEVDSDGETALFWASFWGRAEIVRQLIDRRANVNARTKTGDTPLLEAARAGYVAVARQLLAAGAEVNAADKNGRTPLSWAGADEESEMVRLLAEYGGKR